jgi:hypothetical protein
MNNSTENVTLDAVFVNDILKIYQDRKEPLYQPLLKMAQAYDLSDPSAKIPIQLYNDMCSWLERELGPANLRRVGMQIGETVYEVLKNSGSLSANPEPIELINGLVYSASIMIQDPEKRGWVVIESKPNVIILRRTQTFNSILQIGLLRGLVQKTGVKMVEVEYIKSVAKGDEYDDYLITWSS